MITLTDNQANLEFLYVFVKAFKWDNPLEHEQAGGHPMPGRVYRASKNTDTGTYRLFTDSTTMPTLLVFRSLNEAVESSHTSDFRPLSVATLLDFDITDDDLDQLLKWLKSGNKDLKKVLGFDLTPIKVSQPQQAIKTNDEVTDFIECAQKLHSLNPNLLDSLHEYLHFAIQEEENYDEGPISTMFLTLSGKHGTGANVVRAVEKLSRYVSDDRRTNLHETDLFGAITNLLTENTNKTFNK